MTSSNPTAWQRPVPTIGDPTSAAQRSSDPAGWAFPEDAISAVHEVMGARRDIRRFRPDPVPASLVEQVLAAGHAAPSVGHSQPWRFIVVTDAQTRDRAAVTADRERLRQAAGLVADRARSLIDLRLEGIREAPIGIVVACDRRAPARGVLGRATFADADLWSCACAIQNIWISARASGLGLGWVTLFQPAELAQLLGLPDGVETLGWLCLGWPDERPPSPGLERNAWSRKLPLADVVMQETWPQDGAAPAAPGSFLQAPDQHAVVEASDRSDRLLSPAGSLGALGLAVDKAAAVTAAHEFTGVHVSKKTGGAVSRREGPGTLVLVAADHPVTDLGVSPFPTSVTRQVVEAAAAGEAMGVVAARSAGMQVCVVDAGVDGEPIAGTTTLRASAPRGNLRDDDALCLADVEHFLAQGRALGEQLCARGPIALGEVGVGNTTPAAAIASILLDVDAEQVVGRGAGADSAMVERKCGVVRAARQRWQERTGDDAAASVDPLLVLGIAGGPEFAVLTGVVLGASGHGGLVVLDGLATSVAALLAVRLEPAVQAHLIAGQVSRERAHRLVLTDLGLEPLLDLRLRTGEGVGAVLAASLLRQGQQIREETAVTS